MAGKADEGADKAINQGVQPGVQKVQEQAGPKAQQLTDDKMMPAAQKVACLPCMSSLCPCLVLLLLPRAAASQQAAACRGRHLDLPWEACSSGRGRSG